MLRFGKLLAYDDAEGARVWRDKGLASCTWCFDRLP
jgi:hypothetical protein